jgi:predicted nucleic acid-binding protein
LRLAVDVAPERARTATIVLGRIESLTAYDATYLELALRIGGELATLDDKLAEAARRRGLVVLP